MRRIWALGPLFGAACPSRHPTGAAICEARSGQFVAMGAYGVVASSPDGVTWTRRESTTPATLDGVAAGPAGFVAVGGRKAIASADATRWSAREVATSGTVRDVTHDGERFVAVGGDVLAAATFTSGEGTAWARAEGPDHQVLTRIAAGEGTWVALGYQNSDRRPATLLLADAPTGAWEVAHTDGEIGQRFRGLARGPDGFLAVGRGAVLASPDGRVWTEAPLDVEAWPEAVAWTGDRFVAVGEDGAILTSDDGASWMLTASGESRPLHGVASDGRTIVVVGAGGTILTSTDGVGWTARASGTDLPLHAVAFGCE